MQPIAAGTAAPDIPGAERAVGPTVVMFYNVTCPTCQLAAPVADRLAAAFPRRFLGVGQDPGEKLDQFAEDLGTSFASVSDGSPYPVSDAYGVRTVPTLFVLDGGQVVDVVESWDRDGWNRAAARLAVLTGSAAEPVSREGDGLPPFRPG